MRPISVLLATSLVTAALGPASAMAGTDVGNGFGAIGFLPAAQSVRLNAFVDAEGTVLKAGELRVDNGKTRSVDLGAGDIRPEPGGRIQIARSW